MAKNLGINIKIGADLKKFSSDMQNVQRQMRRTGKKMKSIGTSMTRSLTLPLGLMGGAMIKFASDVEESLNKVDVAFGDSSEEVKEFSKTTLKSFGIARGSALEMASTFGDMATSMGINQSAAADMSTKLVGLAGDLASFKNIRIDVAQTALNSIFTGETESLKKLGIVMTQANLSAFALEQGIKKPIKAMSEGEKTMLRYNFVMAKTANAHGDFARTGGGAANQMRIFQEGLKELAEQFGQLILPMFTKIVVKLNAMVAWFSQLDEGIKKTILIVGGIVAAIGPLLIAMGSLTLLIPSITTALKAMTGPVGLVVMGLTAIAVIIAKNWSKIAPKIQEVTDYFTELYNESYAVRHAVQSIVLVFKILYRVAKNSVLNIWEVFKGFGGLIADLFGGMGKLIKGVFTLSFDDVKEGVKQLGGAIKGNMTDVLNGITDNAENMMEDMKGDFADFNDALNKKVKPVVIPIKLGGEKKKSDTDDTTTSNGGGVIGDSDIANFTFMRKEVELLTESTSLLKDGLKEVPEAIDGIVYSMDNLHDEKSLAFFDNMKNATYELKEGLKSLVVEGFEGLFVAIGEQAAGVDDAFENFGANILQSVATFMGQFGKLLIAGAIASETMQKALFTSPGVALAAGIGLVAVAGLIKGLSTQNPTTYGGGGGGGGGGASPVTFNNDFGAGQGMLTLNTVVYGNDIVLSNNRQHNTNMRTRRK